MYLLYDGSCRFCTAGSERLARLCAPGAVVRVSNKDEAGVARLPAAAREGVGGIGGALQLVSPDGEVASGAEAVARALGTRWVWRVVVWVYWVPGLRRVWDWMYGRVARRRYRIMGKTDGCDTGACGVW